MDPIYEDQDQMVKPTASPWPTGLRYGLYAGLFTIVYGLISYLLGFTEKAFETGSRDWIGTLISMVITIGAIVLAIRYHRDKELNGQISYGRALGVGTITTLVISVIAAIWLFVFMAVLEPGLQDIILDKAIIDMENQGMSDAEIEQAKPFVSMFTSPSTISLMTLFFSMLIGVIISLIAAAILKRD